MRSFLVIVFAATATLFMVLKGRAQDCSIQALGTVTQASQHIISGDKSGAKRLLEQAHEQCQTSAQVARAIANTYRIMGNDSDAKFYGNLADRLEGKTQIEFKQRPQEQQGSEQTGPSSGNSYVRQKWALVVGISHFRNPQYNLQYAAKDATDFAAMLTDPDVGRFDKNNVTVLTDDRATVMNLKAGINQIAKEALPEDLVVFYFSSHGTPAKYDNATEAGKEGYIVTYETELDDLYATAFPMDELKRDVDTRVRAGRVVAFMDTCYSGGFENGPRGGKALALGGISTESIARIAQGSGRVVIASSRDSEQSWESEKDGNSYFTRFLIEGMRQKQGLLNVTDLFTYLQKTVPAAVLKEKNAHQDPVISPTDKGVINIVIGTATQ